MTQIRSQYARRAGIVLISLLALPAAAQAQPARIVSVVPSATEALFAMGAGARVVGVGTFDPVPAEASGLPRVGALLDPDIERILSLKPDLMICYASQTDLQTQLERAGVRTFRYRHGTLTDALAAMRRLGKATGHAAAADRLVTAIEHDIAVVRADAANRPKPRVMVVIGREPQSLRAINVSGGFGFLHDLIEAAGGVNVFGEVKKESVSIGTETVLTRAPDVIVELRYSNTPDPDEPARTRSLWRALSSVPAVRLQRIEVLFGGALVVPGPRLARAAEAMARVIHRPADSAR